MGALFSSLSPSPPPYYYTNCLECGKSMFANLHHSYLDDYTLYCYYYAHCGCKS